MNDGLKSAAPSPDWRQCLAIGLAVGLALPISRTVAENLQAGMGYWMAQGLGLLAAGAAGGMVGLCALLLPRPAAKDRP